MITVSGIPRCVGSVSALGKLVTGGASKAVKAAVATAWETADPLTPVDTGWLVSRNSTRIIRDGPFLFVGDFFNDADYALPVARGHHTRSGSWVRPQDFMTPAFVAGKRVFFDQLQSIV